MAKILVVDDEVDTVELIRTILKSEGHETIPAYDGRECLNILKKEKPDLILLDIMMPGMSGWDVLEKIREKHKKMKVAFVSIVEVSPERRKSLLNDGLSDYITKPFTADELVKRVKAML